MDEIFRTAFYQRHNVALNVGSENASNRVSFAYDNDEGVLINTFNKNLSLRYNGKFKLNKWVTITEDVVWKNNESRSKDTDSGYTGVVAAAMYMPASATVYNPLDVLTVEQRPKTRITSPNMAPTSQISMETLSIRFACWKRKPL